MERPPAWLISLFSCGLVYPKICAPRRGDSDRRTREGAVGAADVGAPGTNREGGRKMGRDSVCRRRLWASSLKCRRWSESRGSSTVGALDVVAPSSASSPSGRPGGCPSSSAPPPTSSAPPWVASAPLRRSPARASPGKTVGGGSWTSAAGTSGALHPLSQLSQLLDLLSPLSVSKEPILPPLEARSSWFKR